MKLLLDSTVLIDALRRDRTRWEMLANLAAAEHQLASTAINLAEVYVGLRGREVEEFETLAEARSHHRTRRRNHRRRCDRARITAADRQPEGFPHARAPTLAHARRYLTPGLTVSGLGGAAKFVMSVSR